MQSEFSFENLFYGKSDLYVEKIWKLNNNAVIISP